MSHSPFSPVKLDLLSQFLRAGHVLDVGCGKLHYARWIRQNFHRATITALDLLDQGSEERIVYRKADLEQGIPEKDFAYSSVVAFDVIEHIQSVDFFVIDLYRVLEPGGVLVGSVPHDRDGFLPQYNLTFFHRSDLTHKRYYTRETLVACLQKAGFERVQVFPGGGISPHVVAEFFPVWTRWLVKKLVSLGLRMGLVSDGGLKSELFFVAYKKA